MRTFVVLMGLLSSSVFGVACTNAESTSAGEEGTSTDDVVGLSDLRALEASLGLVVGQGPDEEFTSGACHRALITNGSTQKWQARRYTDGAAFFAVVGATTNAGNHRPILCVDLHSAHRSLSGVALDAVLRYDLGKLVNAGGNTDGGTVVEFERGSLTLLALGERAREESVRARPHTMPFALAPTINGTLDSITLKDVLVESAQGEPLTTDFVVPGAAAYLVHRYAWRKAEDTGVFSVAEDAVGTFKGKAYSWGGGYAEGREFTFAKVVASFERASDRHAGSDAPSRETVEIRPPEEQARSRAPLAECSRERPHGAGRETDGPSGLDPSNAAFSCTGI